MVYVRSDGIVCQNPPIHQRLFRLVFGVFSFMIFFFKSLVGLDTSSSKNSNSRGSFFGGSSGGSGGGGGGGSGSGRPFGPGKPGGGPNIRTMRDINPPTVRGVSGCPGGGCGM